MRWVNRKSIQPQISQMNTDEKRFLASLHMRETNLCSSVKSVAKKLFDYFSTKARSKT